MVRRDESLEVIMMPRIIKALSRVGHPMFLGEIALELHRGLAPTQQCVDALVKLEILRPATTEEIERQAGLPGSIMYAFVNRMALIIALQNQSEDALAYVKRRFEGKE